ncbi:uncharacterized protein VTP21DRAFT_5247 [Calcarisporiella thermophila]|uniref:uncharacterized protein n=1 Tax=Calcarisporiella thermophila TaxID=911321 RepID=UPI0037428A97
MPSEMQKRERRFTYSTLRILLYPVVLAICCPAGISYGWIYILQQGFTPSCLIAMQVEAITSGLQGILSLIVFLLNPAVVRALSHYKIFSALRSSSTSSTDAPETSSNVLNAEV